MSKPFWKGVFPAVTTQLNKDQSVDHAGTARHIEALIASGVTGVVMCGSLGENQQLTQEEKRAVVKRAIEVCKGRVHVLSGVAEPSTQLAISYTADVAAMGADGVMLMPAMNYKGDPRESVAHLRAVAKAVKLPIMIYNNPISYANDITPQMFDELSDVKTFVAIKESSGDVRRVTDLRNTVGDRYALFTGVDDLVLEAAILGIDGWVAGAGLAFPRENQYLWELTRAGKWDEARTLYRWCTPLMHLDTHVKFVQYIKLAIQEFGLGAEWVRAPRLTLTGTERKAVLAVIEKGLKTRPSIPKSWKPGTWM